MRRFDPADGWTESDVAESHSQSCNSASARIVASHLNSGRNVPDRIHPEREKEFLMTCVSGILTKMCLNTSRHTFTSTSLFLPNYDAVRSEIETFLEARQSLSNPDAMDIDSLNGQKNVCRACGQRGHWAARVSQTWHGWPGRQR